MATAAAAAGQTAQSTAAAAGRIKQGDRVTIRAREANAGDTKSGLYFAHYAHLRGTVLRIYSEEAAVQVERDSLPEAVRLRHDEGEQAMRAKWLDNLSETARGSLSEREKNFALNYAVLVSVADLLPAGADAPAPAAPVPATAPAREQAKGVARAARALDPLTGESDVERADPKADGASESGSDSAVKRASAADLDQSEDAFLAERAAAAGSKSRSPRQRPQS